MAEYHSTKRNLKLEKLGRNDLSEYFRNLDPQNFNI